MDHPVNVGGDDDLAPLLGDQGSTTRVKVSQGKYYFPVRYRLALLMTLGFVNIYGLRVNLSVAIEAMVNSTAQTPQTYNGSVCLSNLQHGGIPNRTQTRDGEFDWNTKIQGQILGAFFYGYIVTQVPGGWLAGRVGAKWPFGLSLLLTTVMTLLTPLAAYQGPGWLIAVRIIEGLSQGVDIPCMFEMFSHWAPPLERTRLIAFVYAGISAGTGLYLPLSGYLAGSHFLGGWPSVFYVTGAISLLWIVAWLFMAYDTPREHPRISKEELEYIEARLEPRTERDYKVPWFALFTSLPMWAITICAISDNFGFYLLLTNYPKYLKEILHYDLSQAGLISAIPSISQWLFSIVSGYVADVLREKGLSTVATRKIFSVTSLVLQAGFILAGAWAKCNLALAVTFLTISSTMTALGVAGYNANRLDISPKFAGIIAGFSNSAATIGGFVAPMIVGHYTADVISQENWVKVFYITAGVFMVGALVYLLFASGEQQPWDRDAKRESQSHNGTKQ